MSAPFPPWLAALQRDFGQMLRTPFDRNGGRLEADMSRYPDALCREAKPSGNATGRERLATYNRQYWFRLFSALQHAFPLVTRLFGHFHFNEHATRYLLEVPPTHADIGRVADGFDHFMVAWIDAAHAGGKTPPNCPPWALLTEAVQLDAAWHRAFTAPEAATLALGPRDAARLPTCRLRLSPAAALVRQSYPLFALRARAIAEDDESPFPSPLELPASEDWLLMRTPQGMAHTRLASEEARLLHLLQEHPVGRALALLEAATAAEARAALPDRAQAWLARSMRLGLWTHLEEG
jgi:hypothetical protein